MILAFSHSEDNGADPEKVRRLGTYLQLIVVLTRPNRKLYFLFFKVILFEEKSLRSCINLSLTTLTFLLFKVGK